jgi:hypothetical protein
VELRGEADLARARDLMTRERPDWGAAIDALARARDRGVPNPTKVIDPLMAFCRENLGAERQVRQAEEAIASFDPVPARLLLESVPPGAHAAPVAKAMLAWLDAEQALREADHLFDRGDAEGALMALQRVEPRACGQFARQAASEKAAREDRWSDVPRHVSEAWRCLDGGDLDGARTELEAIVGGDPSLTAYRAWALEGLRAVHAATAGADARACLTAGVDALVSGNDLAAMVWLRTAVKLEPAVRDDVDHAIRAAAPGRLDDIEDMLARERPRFLLDGALLLLEPALGASHPLSPRLSDALSRVHGRMR